MSKLAATFARFSMAALTALISLSASAETGYRDNPKAIAFIEAMSQEGFEKPYLEQLLLDARRQQSILEAIARPAEKRLTWGEYRKIFLGADRIKQGVEFWKQHEGTLRRASEIYGVAPEVIVAIIGVETRYGRHAGNYRVLDALSTLAFDYPPRSEFFTGQLREMLYLLKEEGLKPEELKGSYAGAMGFGQFIPSSYRAYAVDFDRDGKRNILTNPVDAIGSVANYFQRHGWKTGQPVTVTAKVGEGVDGSVFSTQLKPEFNIEHWRRQGVSAEAVLDDQALATAMKLQGGDGDEHWLGLHNFYVITRYNHSKLYAMAVYQLSREILMAREAA